MRTSTSVVSSSFLVFLVACGGPQAGGPPDPSVTVPDSESAAAPESVAGAEPGAQGVDPADGTALAVFELKKVIRTPDEVAARVGKVLKVMGQERNWDQLARMSSGLFSNVRSPDFSPHARPVPGLKGFFVSYDPAHDFLSVYNDRNDSPDPSDRPASPASGGPSALASSDPALEVDEVEAEKTFRKRLTAMQSVGLIDLERYRTDEVAIARERQGIVEVDPSQPENMQHRLIREYTTRVEYLVVREINGIPLSNNLVNICVDAHGDVCAINLGGPQVNSRVSRHAERRMEVPYGSGYTALPRKGFDGLRRSWEDRIISRGGDEASHLFADIEIVEEVNSYQLAPGTHLVVPMHTIEFTMVYDHPSGEGQAHSRNLMVGLPLVDTGTDEYHIFGGPEDDEGDNHDYSEDRFGSDGG
ncbi:MAG: hypothetical protein V3V08_02580 [Nannocystaceae bacterium]